MNPNLTDKQERWRQILDRFDCKIEYLEGDQNVVADALSRKWISMDHPPEEKDFIPDSTDPLPPTRSIHFSSAAATLRPRPLNPTTTNQPTVTGSLITFR